jgi:aminoglycoside phosphotransferase
MTPPDLPGPGAFDMDALVAIARRSLPALKGRHVEPAARGCENRVLLVDDQWIIRFRRSVDVPAMRTETALLRALEGRTQLPIPRIEVAVFDGPAPFVAYPVLRGEPLPRELSASQRDAIAAHLGGFAADMHAAMPWQDALQTGVPLGTVPSAEIMERGMELLADERSRRIAAAALAICAEASEDLGTRMLLHNDLHKFNVAWDAAAGRVNGVFDFGDAVVGDYHREFAPMWQMDISLARRMVDAYVRRTGRAVDLRRVVAHTMLRNVYDLAEFGTDPAQQSKQPLLLERVAAMAHEQPSLL